MVMKNEENKDLSFIEDKSKIIKVGVEDEMKKSFISYAMAVNVSRAIPDVRDGLKPVHRRILYSMGELNLSYDKPYRKCARIVGDVLHEFLDDLPASSAVLSSFFHSIPSMSSSFMKHMPPSIGSCISSKIRLI